MKLLSSLLLKLTFSLFWGFGLHAFTQAQEFAKDRLLVQFKDQDQAGLKALEDKDFDQFPEFVSLNKKYQLRSINPIGDARYTRTFCLKFKVEPEIDQLIERYMATSLFHFVEVDYIAKSGQSGGSPVTPNDTYYSNQWQHENANHPIADLKTPMAWSIEQGDSSVVLAIIDTGLKLDHPEFSGRIWKNKQETLNGIDDDNNGKIDDVEGWDFVNNDNDPTDDEGHGTAMGGHAAANANNSFFYAGVDWNCKLMVCKAGNSNNWFYYSDAAAAIYYAVSHGADVINMSFGGFGLSTTLHQAVQSAHSSGLVLVACTGNDDMNQIWIPARFPETIAVGAINASSNRASPFFGTTGTGSNYGSQIDVIAPGDRIFGLDHLNNNYLFKPSGGTSSATALVSGACALLLAQDSSRTPQQIRQILRQTAIDQVGPAAEDSLGFDSYFGFGLVDVYAALNQQTVDIVEEPELMSELALFPNPAISAINLRYHGEGSKAAVYHTSGKKQLELSLAKSAKATRISMDGWESGVYFLLIRNASGELLESRKFICQ